MVNLQPLIPNCTYWCIICNPTISSTATLSRPLNRTITTEPSHPLQHRPPLPNPMHIRPMGAPRRLPGEGARYKGPLGLPTSRPTRLINHTLACTQGIMVRDSERGRRSCGKLPDFDTKADVVLFSDKEVHLIRQMLRDL